MSGSKMLTSTGTEHSTPTYMPTANRVARQIAEGMTGIPQSAVTEVLFNTPLGYLHEGAKEIEIPIARNV